MKKLSTYILISLLLFGSIFSIPAEKVEAQTPPINIPTCVYVQGGILVTPLPCRDSSGNVIPAPPVGTSAFSCITGLSSFSTCLSNAAGYVLGTLLYVILSIFALIIGIAGSFLDHVIKFTIVDLKQNISSLTGINIAWKVLKDLFNIVFIFLLLYEGIKMIIGQGSKEGVKRFIGMLVLASLLINFSLFFTKVLIDASNIVTIGLYDTIVDRNAPPANLAGVNVAGISSPYMKALGLSSFWSSTSIDSMRNNAGSNTNMLAIPLLGIFLFMVVSFVFLSMAILLVVRFITIILLLMLSPIAYMGMALPFVSSYSKQWWDSLKSQLIFPPVYMLMTWISLTLMTSTGFFTGGDWGSVVSNPGAPGTMSLILNFMLIIGLAIASLTVAKSTATKGSALIGQATGKLSGYAGGVFMGGSAALMRNSVGRFGANRASNAQLQEDAQKKTGFSGAWARTKLYTARAARDGSYDIRNATVPTEIIGDTVRGTLGRAKIGNFELGKAIGADDFRTSSVPVGSMMSKVAGTGEGGKSYGDTQAEKSKRLRDEQNKDKEELKLAKAREDIINGANADGTNPTDPVYLNAIDKMEKALATLSTKEIETLVDNNRELLSKQEFANRISVKQLEALEKSDKFSDGDKDVLKTNRFMVINDVNSTDPNKVKAAIGRIKGLSDSEIEMLSTAQLSNPDIVKQFRAAQFESIAKSSKFTGSQKKSIKEMRLNPLFDALDPRRPGHVAGSAAYPNLIRGMITKSLTPKDVAGLMATKYQFTNPTTGALDEQSILLHPQVISQYTPNLLKRMGQEMTTEDIQEVRNAIAGIPAVPGTPVAKLQTWIDSQDGINNFS